MHGVNNIKFIWHLLSITAFCIEIYIYIPGRRLSNSKLLFNLFGIIPIVDSVVFYRPLSAAIFLLALSSLYTSGAFQ